MELYTAWHALVTGQGFIWYLILAILIMACFFGKLLLGYKELIGQDTDELQTWFSRLNQQRHHSEKNKMARWRVDLLDIIIELKHDRKWARDAKGEALMVRAIMRALSYIKSLALPETSIDTVQKLHEFFNQHPTFVQISGEEAQAIANRSQLAMALSLSQSDEERSTVALVIPGEIYPGSVFSKNNPMVLWIGENSVMEMQAAGAFSHQHPVIYYAVKNRE